MFLGNSRRRWKNLLISPETQIRYGALFLSIAIVSNLVLTLLATNVYYSWMNGTMEPTATKAIVASLGLCLFAYLLIYGFSFILGLLISHKILGPTVALSRYVEKLKDGRYEDRIRLRENDEPRMQELAESLNQLAAQLERQRDLKL